MRRVILLIIIFFLCVSSSLAGFLDDVFKAVGDGIKQGIQQGAGQSSGGSRNTKGGMPQKQAYDEQRGVELYNKGIHLRERRKHREAIIELEKAAAIARVYNNAFGEMNCLLIIGLSYGDLHEQNKAVSYFKNVFQIARRVGDKEREHSAISMLVVSYRAIGDYVSAISYHEQELSLAREKGNKKEEIEVIDSIGRDYFARGDTIKAMSYIEEGLTLSRESGNKQLEMEHLDSLSKHHNYMGNVSKALIYIQQALTLSRELGSNNKEADYLHSLGEVYSQIGDYKKAIFLFEKSLKLQREAKNDLGELVTLHALGHIYEALGDYPSAVKYYEQNQRVAQNMKFKMDIDPGYMAIPYLLNGNMSRAEEKIKLSKAELYKSLYYLLSERPKDAIAKLPKDELLSFPKELFASKAKSTLFGTYTIMGLAYEKLKDLKTAQFCFKMAVDIMERQREELQEEDKKHFFGAKDYPPLDRLSPYEGLIRVSLPEDAFVYSEATKARILLEQMAGQHEKTNFNIPETVKLEDISLNNSISELLKKQEIAFKLDDKENITTYEKEINKLKEKRNSFIEQLYIKYPEYATIRYPKPLKLSEIKLNPGEVLIEYTVSDNKTLGWLVKNGAIIKTLVVDISQKKMGRLIDQYREEVSTPAALQKPHFDYEQGYKLYTLLIKDFMPSIDPYDKIIIIPDKKLGLLPFEALVTRIPEKGNSPKNKQSYSLPGIKYLGDDYDITYYQSASTLTTVRTLKKGTKTERSLFVLSDPIFDVTDSRLKKHTQMALEKTNSNLMGIVEDATGLKLARLDKTATLASNLLKLFAGQGADQLTGIEASETNLKRKDLSKYRYLVLATHGLLDNKISGIMEPALVLGQVGNKESDDGFLTMSEIMDLRLNCSVAALTACETGSGKLVNGEGVMGLGRAFQYAGANSVLASLWSVAEDSTVKLVERFFYYLKDGKNKSTALRMARNDIRKIGYDHPFFWAPFILIGEGK